MEEKVEEDLDQVSTALYDMTEEELAALEALEAEIAEQEAKAAAEAAEAEANNDTAGIETAVK